MTVLPSTRIQMKHVKKAMIFMIDIFIDILKKLAFFEGGYLKIIHMKMVSSLFFYIKLFRTAWLCAALVYLQL